MIWIFRSAMRAANLRKGPPQSLDCENREVKPRKPKDFGGLSKARRKRVSIQFTLLSDLF